MLVHKGNKHYSLKIKTSVGLDTSIFKIAKYASSYRNVTLE